MNFIVTDLGRKTWQIDSYHAVSMFLIEGDNEAMLIDTGAGIGDLKAQVEELTDKPLIVVNTHGHLDHTGGNMQFPEVWLDPDDLEMDQKMNTQDVRVNYARSRVGNFWPEKMEEAVAAVLPSGEIHYRELREGMVFDLGNRPVEVIKTPGHSRGSVVLLDRAAHQLFTGDMVNFQVLIYKGMSTPMDVYADSLRKIKARSGEFDRILRGHDRPIGSAADMDVLLSIVEDIMSGRDVGHYEEAGMRQGGVVAREGFSVGYEGPEGKTLEVD